MVKPLARFDENDKVNGCVVLGIEAALPIKKRTLQWAWDKLETAIYMLGNNQIRQSLKDWYYNLQIEIIHRKHAIWLWSDRLREFRIRILTETVMHWIINMRMAFALSEAEDKINDEIMDRARDGDGVADIPLDLSILWHFRRPDTGEWVPFDQQTMHDMEFAHNAEELKCKVAPDVDFLKITPTVKGSYLCVIHSRTMINIDTGEKFDIQRSMPKITYQVLEVGAVGPGDRAGGES